MSSKIMWFGFTLMKQLLWRLVFCLNILLLAVTSSAQDQPAAAPKAQVSGPSSVSKKELTSHGFRFDEEKWPLCKVEGPEGPCEVEAFVYGEAHDDKTAHTCSKLDKATYVGHCVRGKLEGLSLVTADGTTKQAKEAFVSYFLGGRITYPALTSLLTKDLNLGAQDLKYKVGNLEAPRCGYGCVYFGKWDRSVERCGRFSEIFGADLFTESNARKLRDGTFDLSHYNAKFLEFLDRK